MVDANRGNGQGANPEYDAHGTKRDVMFYDIGFGHEWVGLCVGR
jgi:hypothetical protein